MRNDNNLTDSSRKKNTEEKWPSYPTDKEKNCIRKGVRETHRSRVSMREKEADKNEEMNVYVTEKA